MVRIRRLLLVGVGALLGCPAPGPSEPVSGSTCTATQVFCGSACVDLSGDRQNCGKCGSSCTAAQQCVSGSCRCIGDSCEGYPVKVSLSGTGSGRVTSEPAGIDCGDRCVFKISSPTVTLQAKASVGSEFTEWSGPCAGSGARCTVKVDGPLAVTAIFQSASRSLTVTKSGDGAGEITSEPAGIQCGTQCRAAFPINTQVRLRARPSQGSAFQGWLGACSGMDECVVTLDADSTAIATFRSLQPELRVTRIGAGSGTITSTPAGIQCGATCSAYFTPGTKVSLSAQASPGSMFTRWVGACNGAGTCEVTLNKPELVQAEFVVNNSGETDPGFGSNGCVLLGSSTSTSIGTLPEDLVLTSNGAIRLGGTYVTPNFGAGSTYQPWFGALTPSGQPESVFGTNWQFALGASGQIDRVDITPQGTLVGLTQNVAIRVSGSSFGRVAVLPSTLVSIAGAAPDSLVAGNSEELYRALNISMGGQATLDTNFGQAGTAAIALPTKATAAGIQSPFQLDQVLVDNSGRIYVIGRGKLANDQRVLVMRYDPSGALDPQFEQGVLILASPQPRDVVAVFDSTRTHLMVAFSSNHMTSVLARVNASGLDTSYQPPSTLLQSMSFSKIAVLPDGRVMVADTHATGIDLVRLLPNGALDSRYHQTGTRLISPASVSATYVSLSAIAVRSSGSTLVLMKRDAISDPGGALCQFRP